MDRQLREMGEDLATHRSHTPQEDARLTPRVLGVAALGWFLLAAFAASGTYWNFRGQGQLVPWTNVFLVSAAGTLPWLLITPIILWLGGRFPVHERGRIRTLPVHLAASIVLLAVTSLGAEALQAPLLGLPLEGILERTLSPTRGWLWIDWFLYWAVLGIGAAWRLGRAVREREAGAARLALQNAELRAELTEAHLEHLRARLEPHFLFNSLNSIQALTRRGDARAADAMIGRLGALLRSALTSDRRPWIPLADEAEHARAYLELEQIRLGDRMEAEVTIDRELLAMPVPPLLLQPLLENAVRHGLSEISGPGRVRVTATRHGSMAHVRIVNDGPVVPIPSPEDDGTGLRITRERLARAYDGRAQFRLEPGPRGGGVVTVLVPLEPYALVGEEEVDEDG